MRRNLPCLIAMFLAFCLPTIAQAKEWRGIVPLKSTRDDVERLLGAPGKHGRYQFENERAYIDYAGDGPCDPVNNCLCRISKDTVMSIHVELEVEMRFSGLNLDKKKYKKHVSPQDPTTASYSNYEEGIIYTVDEEHDDVTDIQYLPTAKDCKEIIRSGKPAGVQNLRHKTRCGLLGASSLSYLILFSEESGHPFAIAPATLKSTILFTRSALNQNRSPGLFGDAKALGSRIC